MTWSGVSPDGTQSVKANRAIIGNNTTYIQNTMGIQAVGTNPNPQTTKDHFWNMGSQLDGRHRFIQMPNFTVGSNQAAIPNLANPIDLCVFANKTTPDGSSQLYIQNATDDFKYQVTPNIIYVGPLVVPSSYITLASLPSGGVYGEIFMYTTAGGEYSAQQGFFKVTGGGSNLQLDAWANIMNVQGSSSDVSSLKFANGSDSPAESLDILVRTSEANSGQAWFAIITYRALN